LFNRTKSTAIIVSILLATVLAAAYPYVASVKAQNQATIEVLESIGGSTDPAPGTHSFNGGTQVTLTATPDPNAVFETWLISTDTSNDTITDNPYTLTVAGGVTYQVSAVFSQLTVPVFPSPPQTPLPLSAYGSVTILQSVGGHTQPAAGTRFFTSVYKLTMTAIADSGWTFDHWIISGDINTGHGGYPFTLTPENNPYTFDCGLGYQYAYQPVFVPVDSGNGGTPPPTAGGLSTETIMIILAVALVIAVVVAAIGGYSYGKRSKK